MSLPLVQQPPPVTLAQQPYRSHATHASIGPVIAVLLVIIVLGIVAGMIGRLCSGRKIMGYGQCDIQSWVETKFSSCIDGRVYPPQQPSGNASAASVPPSIQHQPQQTTTAP
ncbi:Telomere maintenance component 1, putative isoform 1 [Hibiscus syriacus]|uniref:Telomere maintenance component 1, putative isoform 1 n=1 Tax=Hibiscus syriacus TaxID=106335 RepID=A0A6A2XT38_HIBSY|nr:uncharacterized protein LOC120194523 [Hibiscus syriacus]KAE8657104.1 Telomere maintenance component 1, putative isoform 1 [Hibiscus syriacus]